MPEEELGGSVSTKAEIANLSSDTADSRVETGGRVRVWQTPTAATLPLSMELRAPHPFMDSQHGRYLCRAEGTACRQEEEEEEEESRVGSRPVERAANAMAIKKGKQIRI